jgi:hypothetical protein
MLLAHLKQVSAAGKSAGEQLPVEPPTLQLMACAETTMMAASTAIWANLIINVNGPVVARLGVSELCFHGAKQGGGWQYWVGTRSAAAQHPPASAPAAESYSTPRAAR